MLGEQRRGAREHDFQVGAQLVGYGDPVAGQVPAGPHRGAQGGGLVAVAFQGAQPACVGADHVGQHVGAGPVVFVAGRPVAAAQVLDLACRDDEHGQPGRQQRVHDWPVAALDAGLPRPGGQQPGGQLPQPGRVVADGEPLQHLALAAATQTAWSSLAQSTPAVTRAAVALGSILIVVLSLLHQWEDTRWSRDTAAGRSLIGAR